MEQNLLNLFEKSDFVPATKDVHLRLTPQRLLYLRYLLETVSDTYKKNAFCRQSLAYPIPVTLKLSNWHLRQASRLLYDVMLLVENLNI